MGPSQANYKESQTEKYQFELQHMKETKLSFSTRFNGLGLLGPYIISIWVAQVEPDSPYKSNPLQE